MGALLGCKAPPAEVAEQAAPLAIPPPPKVEDTPGPYVLRYFSAVTGELLPAKTPSEIPEAARGQVLVAPEDPKLHGPWLYVADLSKKGPGGYAVRAVDRSELEKARAAAHPGPSAATAAGPSLEPPAGAGGAASPGASGGSVGPGGSVGTGQGLAAQASDRDVVIYRTAWCGYCKKAADYLRLKGVAYVEKDLETDPGARADMLARARRAGVAAESLQGVPILSVRGRIISGFNRAAIDSALGG